VPSSLEFKVELVFYAFVDSLFLNFFLIPVPCACSLRYSWRSLWFHHIFHLMDMGTPYARIKISKFSWYLTWCLWNVEKRVLVRSIFTILKHFVLPSIFCSVLYTMCIYWLRFHISHGHRESLCLLIMVILHYPIDYIHYILECRADMTLESRHIIFIAYSIVPL